MSENQEREARINERRAILTHIREEIDRAIESAETVVGVIVQISYKTDGSYDTVIVTAIDPPFARRVVGDLRFLEAEIIDRTLTVEKTNALRDAVERVATALADETGAPN